MKEQSPLFKLADLARNKGFKAKTLSTRFTMNAVLGLNKSKTFLINDICLYLLLCEIQKWLREFHDINIQNHFLNKKYAVKIKYGNNLSENIYNKDTYEEALEEALQEALKLI